MPSLYIDYPAVEECGRGTEATDGTSWENDVVTIPVCISVAEVSDWLAAYDPTNQYSPNAANSRIIARAVLDALKKHDGG